MATSLQPDDVLIAVLYHVGKGQEFTADRERLHRIFFQLKQQHRDCLAPIRFRDRGLFPESAGLDQALSNLEATGLLLRKNDAPRFYYVQEALRQAYEQFVQPRLQRLRFHTGQFQDIAKEVAAAR